MFPNTIRLLNTPGEAAMQRACYFDPDLAACGAATQCNTCAAATRISLPTDDAMPHVCGAVTQISPAGVVIVVTRGCGGDHRRGLWQSGDAMWPARLHEKDDGVRWR